MNIKKSTVAVMALLLSLLMLIALVPITAMAASNSTVVLHPSSGTVPTGVKVKVGDKIDGHPVTGIKGNDITVDLGKYNVSLDEFRIPLPEEIWKGVKMQYNPQTYVIAGTAGAVHKTPGANALLGNGKNTFYYYNLGKGEGDTDTGSYLWNFELKFDANGGTGAPGTLTYGTNDKYAKSHTFTIPDTIPTRDGYTFRGWADTKNATEATKQPGGSCYVLVPGTGYNGGSVSKTLYAVWQLNEIEPSEPESSEVSEPESSNTSEPESSNTSEPESSNTSEPESSNTSEPESSNTSEPESSNTSEPESSNTSEPESSNTSEPESSNTSEPESSNTSEISGDPSGDNSDESSNTGDDSNTGDNESSNAGDNSGAGDNSNAGDNSGSSDNSNAGDSSDSGKNPQTGENSFTLMIALLLLCGSAVVGTAVVSRKQKAN